MRPDFRLCLLMLTVAMVPLVLSDCSPYPFGYPASLFNGFFLGSYSGSSDVQGRLAAGGDITLHDFSVGSKLFTVPTSCSLISPSDWRDQLVAGGTINWGDNGTVFSGNMVAGSYSNIAYPVLDSLLPGCAYRVQSNVINFASAQTYLQSLSTALAGYPVTGSNSMIGGTLSLTPSGSASEVFSLNAATLLTASSIALTGTFAPGATIIFNVVGAAPDCGFNNLDMASTLGPLASRIVWNFYACSNLHIGNTNTQVYGSILAPSASLINPQGTLYGQLFADDFSGPLEISWIPFQGCLPCYLNPTPPAPTPAPTPSTPPTPCIPFPPPPCVVTGVTSLTGSLLCNQNVTITGSRFTGNTIYCDFGVSVVTATILSDTTAMCPVPTVLLDSTPIIIYTNDNSCGEPMSLVYVLNQPCCVYDSSAAVSWGDPYVNTIDGTTYNSPGNGTFYFMRQTNGDFVVQVKQIHCSTAYCNGPVAIKFLDVIIFVDYSTSNGIIHISNTTDLGAAHITVNVLNPQKYQFALPSQIYVLVQTLPWAAMNIYYLNLKVTLPSSYKTYVYGLAGYYDGNPANDKSKPDGTVAADTQAGIAAFVKSWLVPDDYNLFLNSSAQIPSFLNGGIGSPSTLICTAAPTACMPSTDSDGIWPRASFNTTILGQCLPDYVGNPTKFCNPDGQLGPVMNPCVPKTSACANETYHNAVWPTTFVNTTAFGACINGYSGNPTRYCTLSVQWSTAVNNYCTLNTCPAKTESNAQWSQTNAFTTATGSCNSGYTGKPTRACNADGTWGQIVNPCVPTANCPFDTNFGHANWTATASGQTATGICYPGWSGSPKRVCQATGVWQTTITNPCQRIYCPLTQDGLGHAQFNTTASNQYAYGVCLQGYSSTSQPMRYCNINGSWDTAIRNPCT